jgi:hypothetical protein
MIFQGWAAPVALSRFKASGAGGRTAGQVRSEQRLQPPGRLSCSDSVSRSKAGSAESLQEASKPECLRDWLKQQNEKDQVTECRMPAWLPACFHWLGSSFGSSSLQPAWPRASTVPEVFRALLPAPPRCGPQH